VGSATSSGAAGAPAAFSPPKVDVSLTPAEYVERGLPPVDRPWSAGEMNQARQVSSPIPSSGSTGCCKTKS
jgi:hypothetical protein